MTDKIRFLLLVCVFSLLVTAKSHARQDDSGISLQGTAISFASVDDGKKLIGASDEFVKSLSEFDRGARLGTSDPVKEATFLKHAAEQVRAWDDSEVKKLSEVIGKVDARVDELKLEFAMPDQIQIIKTTGMEEAGPGAPYTRGSAIVMPAGVLQNLEGDNLTRIFLHELFHVLTRHDSNIRKPLYAIVGFQPCNEIEYPKSLMDRKLTNPDAHHFDSFIELNISDKETKLTPVTLARDPSIREGGILANVTIEFLELEQNGEQTKPKMKDDKPVVLGMREVMNSYMAKVGRNTNYIIHPEEIMADNFSMAIMGRKTAPNPEILESVLKYFAKK